MGRPGRRVVFDAETRARLLEIIRSRNQPCGSPLRAQIILQCMEGLAVKEIARINGVIAVTVIRWKSRFIAEGMAGLFDRHRRGRPAIYQAEFKQSVLKKLEQGPPAGFSEWDEVIL